MDGVDGLAKGNLVKVEVIDQKIIINGKALADATAKKYQHFLIHHLSNSRRY